MHEKGTFWMIEIGTAQRVVVGPPFFAYYYLPTSAGLAEWSGSG